MAGVKTTSYIDELRKVARAENLVDIKAALEIVEGEHNTFIETIGELRRRIEKIERETSGVEPRLAEAIRSLDSRIRRLEHGEGPKTSA